MTTTLDRAAAKRDLALAAPAGRWCTDNLAEIERSFGKAQSRELLGYLFEIALVAHRKGELAQLTPAKAVELAIERVEDEYIVARPRAAKRPQIIGFDAADEFPGSGDPLSALLLSELERGREDNDCDHDDRLSIVARRAAAGHQPVAPPKRWLQSLGRLRRRYGARTRHLHDAGQLDFWPGPKGAA